MRIELLGIEKLWSNSGQIDGLPANPRKWDANDVKRLAKSIEETPELLEARPPIVVFHNGFYVVLGGNMRLEACRYLDYEMIPCVVMDEGTSIETLKQIVIKDNGSFGEWDSIELKKEWADLPLPDWGVTEIEETISSDDFGESFVLASGPKAQGQMTFVLANEQIAEIKHILGNAKKTREFELMETFGNKNTNGNAIFLILKQWEEQRKL